MSKQNASSSCLRKFLLFLHSHTPMLASSLLGMLSIFLASDAYARDVTPDEALALSQKAADGLCILDVRTPKEYAKGHIPGAINIDVTQASFSQKAAELKRDVPLLVYCRSGRRSRVAVTMLETLAFTTIWHMKDGWIAWEKAGLPIAYGSN